MQSPHASLARFERQPTVLLTTYRRGGTPVATPVHLAVHGDRAYFRTWHTTGKLKRIRNEPLVTIAPSTMAGRPTGGSVPARARILDGVEARQAARLLGAKYPILHSWLIPLAHRLTGKRTVHVELLPIDEAMRRAHAAWRGPRQRLGPRTSATPRVSTPLIRKSPPTKTR